MRPYLLFVLSGCSLVADYDRDLLPKHDGHYVLEGALQADTCDMPAASTVRLPVDIRGHEISGVFECAGTADVSADVFYKEWVCSNHRASLTGTFEMSAMDGVYTLAYPTCERSYAVTGSRL